MRKPLLPGLNTLIDKELARIRLDLLLSEGVTRQSLEIQDREYAVVLIRGRVQCRCPGGDSYDLGPRVSPFIDKPWALLASESGVLEISLSQDSLVAVASAPVQSRYPTQLVTPEEVREKERGRENWKRKVRLVCWSDNTSGEQLLIGETVTPSGNWSTIPPHRHAQYVAGDDGPEEVPYEEVYCYQFSRPTGFGMNLQFDKDGTDDAYSLRSGDAVYIDGGYHPVVCAPGADMYQLTVMAGPYRQSTAAIHPDFRYLLGEGGDNPFRKQESP